MTEIERLELMVAELKAEVAYWKSYVRNEKPFNPPGSNPCSEIILTQPEEYSYHEEQQRWRDAGWNAYNSDYVDEFPTW